MTETRTWTLTERELDICAALVPNATLEFDEGDEILDAWFWFASKIGSGQWFAFAISDTPNDPDEMLSNSDDEELIKLSVWIGDTWDVIELHGVQPSANLHRDALDSMDDDQLEAIREIEDDRLIEIRRTAEGERMNRQLVSSGASAMSNN